MDSGAGKPEWLHTITDTITTHTTNTITHGGVLFELQRLLAELSGFRRFLKTSRDMMGLTHVSIDGNDPQLTNCHTHLSSFSDPKLGRQHIPQANQGRATRGALAADTHRVRVDLRGDIV